MNEFTNASRVLKQVDSLTKNKVFEKIIIIALGSEKLKSYEEITDDIVLHRIRLYTRNLPKGLFFQLIKYVEFFIRTLLILFKIKPKVINAHALSVLPFAIFAKYFLKALVVYDAHELETEQSAGLTLRKRLSKWLEKKLIHKVDMMLVVSESIADWYVAEYDISRPVVVLNAPKRRGLKTNNHFREQLAIGDEQIILLYQGGLFAERGVQLILDAFKARSDNKIVGVFMGYGELEQDIKNAASERNNIFFFPAVPPQVVLEYTSSADMGIHLIQNTCLNHDYCMPNKLFEYSMAGLPVLVSNMKDMSELVLKNNMGAVISDFSAKGINQAIDEFLNQNLTIMKKNAYNMASENSWEIQEQAMLSAYKKMFELKGSKCK
ncbi:glycosyl transferase, group 1 [Acinetobacter junii CIP 107470 = MTCC 11364]|uniref:Glycosyl transferase, group 1 n=2 Tax=Acinetobacter junii TaxID=40215 RepID=S7WY34_ACIJU|nr:glycosyl transferase, group 1 [Acinetobacter junii CIP 107470 = MTCC 11364]